MADEDDGSEVLRALADLARAVGTISDKIDGVDERNARIERRLENVEIKADETRQDLRTFRAEAHERFDAIDRRLSVVEDREA